MKWLSLLLLTACTQQPVIQTVTVRVPVAVPCVAQSDLPARPDIMLNQTLLSLDDYHAVLGAWIERGRLLDYSTQLEAILQVCIKP